MRVYGQSNGRSTADYASGRGFPQAHVAKKFQPSSSIFTSWNENFQAFPAFSLSTLLTFEHCSIKWTFTTLNPCTSYCVKVSDLHISHQDSSSKRPITAWASSEVLQAEITYGKDCTDDIGTPDQKQDCEAPPPPSSPYPRPGLGPIGDEGRDWAALEPPLDAVLNSTSSLSSSNPSGVVYLFKTTHLSVKTTTTLYSLIRPPVAVNFLANHLWAFQNNSCYFMSADIWR